MISSTLIASVFTGKKEMGKVNEATVDPNILEPTWEGDQERIEKWREVWHKLIDVLPPHTLRMLFNEIGNVIQFEIGNKIPKDMISKPDELVSFRSTVPLFILGEKPMIDPSFFNVYEQFNECITKDGYLYEKEENETDIYGD